MFEIDSENSLEQARPPHARRRAVRVFVLGLACTLRWTRHDRGAQPGIGGEHAVKADQMQARSRHQRGQALRKERKGK